MSREVLAKVVQRAIGDAAFRRQLSKDPSGALRGFNLTADEAAAIRSGDPGRLTALGIDQRISKALALGATASRMSDTDLGAGASTSISTGTDGGASNADLDAGNASGNALITGSGTDGNALISDPMTAEGHNVLVGYTGSGTIIPADPTANVSGDADVSAGFTTADASNPAVGAQNDSWVIDEGHEQVVGFQPQGVQQADAWVGADEGQTIIGYQPGTGVAANDTLSSTTYSGDDIAGPAGGLASDPSAGGASPVADPGDGPEITP